MDKIMKRQIGYTKPKPESVVKRIPISVTPKFQNGVLTTDNKKLIKALDNSPANASLPDRLAKSKMIADWINTHPEFKWSAMCKKLGIDKGNFQRSFKAEPPNLSSEVISKVEGFLKNYGYGN